MSSLQDRVERLEAQYRNEPLQGLAQILARYSCLDAHGWNCDHVFLARQKGEHDDDLYARGEQELMKKYPTIAAMLAGLANHLPM